MLERFNIQEFSEKVGVSSRTIYRYIDQGKLTPKRLPSGLPFFLQKDVDLFLDGKSEEISENVVD